MTKQSLFVAVLLTFLTIVAWVIFDILHTQKQVEIPPKTQEVLEPINPNFDTGVLNQ